MIRTTHTETGSAPDHQLYRLGLDIGEAQNLAYRYPKIVESMAKRINEILANK